jgi:hypothetical protein
MGCGCLEARPDSLGCGGPKACANQRSSRLHETSASGAAACAVHPPWSSVSMCLQMDYVVGVHYYPTGYACCPSKMHFIVEGSLTAMLL